MLPSFLSEPVISAYMSPQIDKSSKPFSWGKPDLSELRKDIIGELGFFRLISVGVAGNRFICASSLGVLLPSFLLFEAHLTTPKILLVLTSLAQSVNPKTMMQHSLEFEDSTSVWANKEKDLKIS